MEQEKDKMYEVNRLYKECVMRGRACPLETARAIYQAMGGLTRVDFDPQKCLRLYNHSHNMGISQRGLKRRQSDRLEELVVLMHHLVQEGSEGFDQSQVSAIRLEPKGGTPMSTKHHMPAYLRFQRQVLEKYAA